MDRFVVISGCSGGGKSTLIEELDRRGFQTVPEPGRRIVHQELAAGGTALPWVDMAAFAARAMEMALADRAGATRLKGWVFFDRCLIDAAAAYEAATGQPVLEQLATTRRYHPLVFLAPPWPVLFDEDEARRHSFDDAAREYDRLAAIYPRLGYQTIELPIDNVSDRADFVLARLRG